MTSEVSDDFIRPQRLALKATRLQSWPLMRAARPIRANSWRQVWSVFGRFGTLFSDISPLFTFHLPPSTVICASATPVVRALCTHLAIETDCTLQISSKRTTAVHKLRFQHFSAHKAMPCAKGKLRIQSASLCFTRL